MPSSSSAGSFTRKATLFPSVGKLEHIDSSTSYSQSHKRGTFLLHSKGRLLIYGILYGAFLLDAKYQTLMPDLGFNASHFTSSTWTENCAP